MVHGARGTHGFSFIMPPDICHAPDSAGQVALAVFPVPRDPAKKPVFSRVFPLTEAGKAPIDVPNVRVGLAAFVVF
jgi:hypothetical protein